jgi:hypothetical protein
MRSYYKVERDFEKRIRRSEVKTLSQAGAYVRKIAQSLIKHTSDPNKHSAPLHPPYDHYGLKHSIQFAVEGNTAYVGPILKKGSSLENVARLHEFGGVRKAGPENRVRAKAASIGSLAMVTENYVTRRDTVTGRTPQKDPKTGKNVVWIKVRTKKQAEHAGRLLARLGMNQVVNGEKGMVVYPPRPYMAPALQKATPYIGSVLANSIK